jgi:hypothetical protein
MKLKRIRNLSVLTLVVSIYLIGCLQSCAPCKKVHVESDSTKWCPKGGDHVYIVGTFTVDPPIQVCNCMKCGRVCP